MRKQILVRKCTGKCAVSELICRVTRELSPTRTSPVYKVRVDDFFADLSTDVYTMTIVESIKEGGCLPSNPEPSDRFLPFPERYQLPYQSYIAADVFFSGSYDVGPQGKQRLFLGYPHCRETIGLIKGKTYLIMGMSNDIYKDDQAQT